MHVQAAKSRIPCSSETPFSRAVTQTGIDVRQVLVSREHRTRAWSRFTVAMLKLDENSTSIALRYPVRHVLERAISASSTQHHLVSLVQNLQVPMICTHARIDTCNVSAYPCTLYYLRSTLKEGKTFPYCRKFTFLVGGPASRTSQPG